MKTCTVFAAMLLSTISLLAQPDRWQQRAEYEMEIDFDVETHRFDGTQRLTYYNNSPDTLNQVFYHLYFNAFQPNSMMDIRSQTIRDADPRVGGRIGELDKEEIGYQRVTSLKMNGKKVKYDIVGTILEAKLPEPVMPNSSVVFEMDFKAQVPLQIRRSGRDNAEGIAYSMAQWYPKMSEYDYQGWHANPYVGREFYGIWGDFDVKITIDKDYILGGTGYLQNPEEIGYGYAPESEVKQKRGRRLTWHFKAPKVHDFMWAADPDYTHDTFEREDGTVLHFLYQKNERTEENWAQLPRVMDKAFDYINTHYGQYPYKQYSFIQGGDGGMEYPMGTLITGERSFPSLVGVSVHELMHSWYQMVLGTNESLYPWMDEGFTSWASSNVMNLLREKGMLPGEGVDNPHLGSYTGYVNFSQSGLEEPLITHADHFVTNSAYGVASYVKGAVFLEQLKYIIGEDAFDKGMLRYYDTWKFKHPNANDFIRVMEKQSGLELDWYKEYWIHTTHQIDYGVSAVENGEKGKAVVTLEKVGTMPMPFEVEIELKDGGRKRYYIPIRLLRGHKPLDSMGLLRDWPWTHPEYEFTLPVSAEEIQAVVVDPDRGMADINPENNRYEIEE
jgi:hypothetical protein